MDFHVDEKLINSAFDQDPILTSQIFNAINVTPQHARLFEDIAKYHQSYRNQLLSNGATFAEHEPAAKKRRLENGVVPIMPASSNADFKSIFEAKDVSFLVPLRKKLQVELAVSFNNTNPSYLLRARNPASQDIEYQAEASSFAHVCRLPVPEKAQKQYNFCLIPSVGEPLVWTVNHGPLKSFSINDDKLQAVVNGSEDVLENVLDFVMQDRGQKVMYPSEEEFASATPEAHRKGEKAYHVKAFRGSKDGFLFFLSTGIFFGFKKPIQFFPFDEIESISYTSVLQRTFNLNITHKSGESTEAEEVEFSMLDQADFAGIDAYIKRHELQDASMAETRRARKIGANHSRKDIQTAVGTNGEDDGDGQTELQKAAAEAEAVGPDIEEDEEDELEEDYDPGSEGESDGSGEDSEEEEEEYAEGEAGGDLVQDELGSEAEEVEPDPEDEDQL